MNTNINEWKLVSHSHQIADTGDYDGCYELTNGKVSLFSKDDDDESLMPIIKALNESGCNFYLDDSAEYELHLLKEENKNAAQFQQQQNKDLAGVWVKEDLLNDVIIAFEDIKNSWEQNLVLNKLSAINKKPAPQPDAQPFEKFMQDSEKENIELHDKIHNVKVDGHIDIEAMAEKEYKLHPHDRAFDHLTKAFRGAYIKGANDYKQALNKK